MKNEFLNDYEKIFYENKQKVESNIGSSQALLMTTQPSQFTSTNSIIQNPSDIYVVNQKSQ